MFIRFIIFFVFISFKSYATDCEKPKMPTVEEWNSWLTNIKQEALERGISQNTISNNLNDVKPQSKIIMRDRCQPASTMTLDEYLFYTITKDKVFAGKNFLKKHEDLLKEIGDYFKIQPRFIVAVLGMESYYGRNQGKINSIIAITTLAFDRRRSDFYKKQLFAALEILDKNLVPSGELKGSWGGAVGMTQMIPTTFLETAFDWDGDGIDIWNSYPDAFASTANYLTSLNDNPWYNDSTWGREVLPPSNIESIYESLQQILKLFAESRMMHKSIILQSMTYKSLAAQALNGTFSKDKHNPHCSVHPVIAALFLPKFILRKIIH